MMVMLLLLPVLLLLIVLSAWILNFVTHLSWLVPLKSRVVTSVIYTHGLRVLLIV